MAVISKLLIALFLLIFVVLSQATATDLTEFETPLVNATGVISEAKINCGGECVRRCALVRRKNVCYRACGTCCARCNCVPPGTSGNQNLCACWASQTTHGGRNKCP